MKIAISGCFDLFHDGHANLLNKAKFFGEQENELLICINSDKSVKELKGDNRPVNKFFSRRIAVHLFLKDELGLDLDRFQIKEFNTEQDLFNLYRNFGPDFILHGNDITDVTKITGHPQYPVMLIDRGFDKNGNRISTTQILEGNNAG